MEIIIILVTTREKEGSYGEEKRKLRISKVRIMFHFLISVAIKQIFIKLHTYALYILNAFYFSQYRMCPLYIAEWKKANYRSICII